MSVFVCKGLKSSGKLCLILDLDHTLVHVCSPSAEQAKNGVTGTSLNISNTPVIIFSRIERLSCYHSVFPRVHHFSMRQF
jgi:predicted HAD superfamily phosphohydrolase YqeG